MKVYGQLEKAMLENIASAAPTPASVGRVYIDITTPGKGVPKVWDGSAWQPLRMGYQASLKYKTASQIQSYLANSNTKHVLDTQVWDTDSIYDGTTGILTPKVTTKYRLVIAIAFSAGNWNVNTLFRALLTDNTASTLIAQQTVFTAASTGAGFNMSHVFVMEEILIAGHAYQIDVDQASAGALVLSGSAMENWLVVDTAF